MEAVAGQTLRHCVRSRRGIRAIPRIVVAVSRATAHQFAQPQRRASTADSTTRAPPRDPRGRINYGGEGLEEKNIFPLDETVEDMVQRLKPDELKALESIKKLDPAAQQMSLEQFIKKSMDEDEDKDEENIKEMVTPQTWKKVSAVARPDKTSFWYDEDDPTAPTEGTEDEFDEDDMTPMGHAKLEEIREYRHYHRIMAWEMPLLSKLAKPFEPPKQGQLLRFRYTTYMGEYHPAEKKVVVQFSPADLELSPVEADKLRKLAGPRYNPETDIIKMSSEKYEHKAQNKRYLHDLVETLIATAKDPQDTFQDIPLDTRHHTFKKRPQFPKEWRMTDQRAQELKAFRLRALEVDADMEEAGHVVDGAQKIELAFATSDTGKGEPSA